MMNAYGNETRPPRVKHAIAGVGVLLVASVTMLASCATTPGRGSDLPAWYFEPDSVYPAGQYLTAVGTGDTTAAAEQQALAAMSQIFQAQVQVDTTINERYRELVTSGGTVSEQDVEMASNLNVRSNQTLLNVQFGERAVDELGRVNVIAYLERVPTGRLYVDLIEKNAAQVERFRREAQSGDLIRRYAFMSAAALVATNTEALRDQLRIIAPSLEQTARVPYDYDTLLQERADLARRVTVSIDINNDQNSRVTGAVREAFSSERFPVTEPAELNVTGTVRIEPIDLNPDYQTVRWNLTLDISRDGASLVTMDESGRASAVTEEAARNFAYRDMEEVIRQRFVGGLIDYFDQLVLGA